MQKVFIIGGAGHIGLTLAAVLSKYYKVILFDINERSIDEFKTNHMAPSLNTHMMTSHLIIIYEKKDFYSKK